MKLIVKDTPLSNLYPYLVSAIGPRPICFASTIDKAGNPNLSPFSFFNIFSASPPILIFSPLRRMRDNTVKQTLENIYEVKEVVVNIVNYEIIQQMNLSSCEYPKGVNEFIKAGLTPLESEIVKPFRVKESPVQMECNVIQIIETGKEKGAGNLILCEILCLHIEDKILDEKGKIDQHKIDLVGRLGGDYYTRSTGNAIFEIPKPNTQLGIGIDALPESIRKSTVLTGNNLGQLANVHEMPFVDPAFYDDKLKSIIQYYSINPDEMDKELHRHAKELLDAGKVNEAWQVLLADV